MARVLTAEEKAKYKDRLVQKGHPVRFMADGCSFNITTGETTSKGCNVMYQTVYWNFTKEDSKEIAQLTGTRAEFDKED